MDIDWDIVTFVKIAISLAVGTLVFILSRLHDGVNRSDELAPAATSASERERFIIAVRRTLRTLITLAVLLIVVYLVFPELLAWIAGIALVIFMAIIMAMSG